MPAGRPGGVLHERRPYRQNIGMTSEIAFYRVRAGGIVCDIVRW